MLNTKKPGLITQSIRKIKFQSIFIAYITLLECLEINLQNFSFVLKINNNYILYLIVQYNSSCLIIHCFASKVMCFEDPQNFDQY